VQRGVPYESNVRYLVVSEEKEKQTLGPDADIRKQSPGQAAWPGPPTRKVVYSALPFDQGSRSSKGGPGSMHGRSGKELHL